MLGNDIVDLTLAKVQSNWKRKGFLEKIFTYDEQLCILKSKNPYLKVWLLWSMKEAAYKIHNRKTGIRNFAPKSLSCTIHSNAYGEVNIEGSTYYTKSDLQTTFIHSIASPNCSMLEEIKISIYEAPDNLFDYKSTKPGCVSHHGRYLALVYLL
ncbi:4'-phosphopantetheinyl transferase family protein [Pedobacter jejuensis]|uniref:4-phosphopantetheinyl transferase family protein n=1 Tax=Pedobacter jejuensis TaxID=1268550 RepID=A0A3N0BZR1_9SPHI|nr:4'-phosphopantetheinyl transferase superfamily protein [Pedobacter jejuensis]RNL55493.1 4-phosphopantetheinyl transferase family protein [Pedobacter jejuensis]